MKFLSLQGKMGEVSFLVMLENGCIKILETKSHVQSSRN